MIVSLDMINNIEKASEVILNSTPNERADRYCFDKYEPEIEFSSEIRERNTGLQKARTDPPIAR